MKSYDYLLAPASKAENQLQDWRSCYRSIHSKSDNQHRL